MSVAFYGDYDTTETVIIPFNTFDSNDPTASVTITNLVAGDIEIHKDGGTTQRSSDSGVTVTIDFDSVTGNHIASIDLSDNTDAGFYSAGSRYQVRIEGTTVDGGTINAWIGSFSIGCTLRSTTPGRTLDVTASGAAGIDWANVEGQGTSVDLSATAIDLCDDVTLTATTTDVSNAVTTDSSSRTASQADVSDIPTNAELNARTLPSADYVLTSDTIAGVTLVATTTDVTNQVSADVTAISGDSSAADNLEATYDGTGYVNDVAPATQSQVSQIANVGSAVNQIASAYTLTTGTQTANLYTDTATLDDVRHTHTDTAGEMELYYEFNIGGGIPSSVTITGKLTGVNDSLEMYGYDWATTTWIRIGTMVGAAQDTNEVDNYVLFVGMVGSGADIGKVRIRFYDGAFTLTNATLYVDQIYVSYSQGAGDYALGAIWVDTNASNTNTVPGIDGISTNPVSTWAAALTLSGLLNIIKFNIVSGSAITLTGNSDNYLIQCGGSTLDLNGQSVDNAIIERGLISGACTGAPFFVQCAVGTTSFAAGSILECAIATTITLTAAADYFFDQCFSVVAGTSTPVLDFGAAVGNTNFSMRHYSGGIEVQNMGQSGTDTMSLEGNGQLVINANCTGGTIAIRGNFTVTDNSGGAVTLSEGARYDTGQIDDTIDANTSIISILEDTGTTIPGQISGLNDISTAEVNTEVDNALNTAIPATGSTTAGSINDYMRRTKFATVNKMEVDEDDGDARMYDDSGTLFNTVAAAFTSASTITKREKLL